MLGYNLNVGLVTLSEMWFSNTINSCNTVIKVIGDFRVCVVSWQTCYYKLSQGEGMN